MSISRLCAFLLSLLPATVAMASPDYARFPVLFVHGSGLSAETWRPMVRYLTENGYPPDYLSAVNLSPDDGDNIRAARLFIAPAVDALLARAAKHASSGAAPNKVDIVAHSMGALSGRWYAAKMRPDRVRTLITLAGANHGTNALCGYPGKGNEQMCPAFGNSRLQRELNGTRAAPRDETPFGVGRDPPGVATIAPAGDRRLLYVTVRVEPDRWIKPERGALLAGAGGRQLAFDSAWFRQTQPGNLLFLGEPDHDYLPKQAPVIKLVAGLLSQ